MYIHTYIHVVFVVFIDLALRKSYTWCFPITALVIYGFGATLRDGRYHKIDIIIAEGGRGVADHESELSRVYGP